MHRIFQFSCHFGHICTLDVKIDVFSQSPRNLLFKMYVFSQSRAPRNRAHASNFPIFTRFWAYLHSRRENVRVFTVAQKPTFQNVRIFTVARPVEPSLLEPAKPASQLARNPPRARNDKKSNSHIKEIEFLVSEMKGLQNWIFEGPASQSAKLASQASQLARNTPLARIFMRF